ncbi:amidase [Rubrobacter aplysinae]|uniref:amidase n=1 Tax=Rubrobacter aplysinae TaxID=909625 RepID=UPI00069CC1E8|nr:amidase [Rubrobacter aplysinae]
MSQNEALAALDLMDPDLGAFIEVDRDRVLAQAKAPRGGRLSGLLIGVKDLVDTAGLRTTYGSKIFADHVPERNAPAVDALEAEGAIVLGKTNLNEFAYGVSGYNPHYGAIFTPRDRSRTAGGSSGGSAAAVSAGVCRLAVGTDTSGSVRIPAACCGVYGLKLTNGAAPMGGIFPLAASYDSLGYLAAGIEDLQQVLGLDELPDPSDLRVSRIGVDLEVPDLPAEHWTLFREQVWEVHGKRYEADPERYGKDLRWKFDLSFDGADQARQTIEAWRSRFLQAVEGAEVLVGPLLDGAAPLLESALSDFEHDEFITSLRLLRHTPLYNELGWPALAVPTEDGPVQVAARPGNEAQLLAVGRSLGLPSSETIVR